MEQKIHLFMLKCLLGCAVHQTNVLYDACVSDNCTVVTNAQLNLFFGYFLFSSFELEMT